MHMRGRTEGCACGRVPSGVGGREEVGEAEVEVCW